MIKNDAKTAAKIPRVEGFAKLKNDFSFKVEAKLNKKLCITISDYKNTIEVYGNIVLESMKVKITKDDIESKITKLGNTIYFLKDLSIDIDDNIFIPISEINNLKRECIEKLNSERCYDIIEVAELICGKGEYSISVDNYLKEEKLSVLTENGDINDYDFDYSNSLDNSIKYLPRVIDNYNNYDNNKLYLVGELGAFNKLKNVVTDFSFNVTNSYTVALLHSLGAKRITLSYELNDKQIENLINAYQKRYQKHPNLELVVYGYLDVMVLKTNLNKIYCNKELYLQDRFNNLYKVIDINGFSYIYDYKKRNIYDKKYYNLGINCLRFNK